MWWLLVGIYFRQAGSMFEYPFKPNKCVSGQITNFLFNVSSLMSKKLPNSQSRFQNLKKFYHYRIGQLALYFVTSMTGHLN